MPTLLLLVLAAQLYRVSPERVVWSGKFPELGSEPFILDFASRRFTRATESELASLAEARPLAMHTETVTLRNHDVKLVGKLTFPDTKKRHPAIVLIHGSNDEDRDYLDPWVGFFVSQGFAVLSYDKRGVRESTGDWKRAGFEDLAGDVLSALRFLKRHRSIDTKSIGLIGFSQGGWIAPIVASRDHSVAFVILHAGSALPVAENSLLFVEAELRGYGFPDDEIEHAMTYYRLNDEVTRHPERWSALQELYQREKARNVEWLIEAPQPADSWFRLFYRKVMDFDPAPFWSKVRCPVLAFFGELDHNVPPEPNRRALDAALQARPSRDSTVIVLPRANHLFLRAETGRREEYPQLTHFVDGYFETMEKWLAQRIRR